MASLAKTRTKVKSRTVDLRRKTNYDFSFLLLTVILLAVGIIMMFSASSSWASYRFNDAYHFLRGQAIWTGVGLIGMFIMSKFDYTHLKKFGPICIIISIIMLIAVLLPGIGKTLNGARRWYNIPGLSLQPSEVVKVLVIVAFAARLSIDGEKKIRNFKKGLLPYLIFLGFVAGLMMLEPHLSGTVVIVGTAVIMLFVAGANLAHFGMMGALALPAIGVLIIKEPYRLNRVLSFLNPEQNKMDGAWQVMQSLYAIGSGSIFGVGLGLSRQKFLYIPEPQNDFVFAIVCEELGFIGATIIMVLFVLFIWRGIKIAMEAPDTFGCLLVVGIISLVAVQMIVNIAVVTSSMPVTGMPLPFFSYGGTSMAVLLSALGIVVNVSKHKKFSKEEKAISN